MNVSYTYIYIGVLSATCFPINDRKGGNRDKRFLLLSCVHVAAIINKTNHFKSSLRKNAKHFLVNPPYCSNNKLLKSFILPGYLTFGFAMSGCYKINHCRHERYATSFLSLVDILVCLFKAQSKLSYGSEISLKKLPSVIKRNVDKKLLYLIRRNVDKNYHL